MVSRLGKPLQAAVSLALLWAQLPSTEAGFLLPTRDTLYILVVFAEIDYSECGEDPHEKQYGNVWGRNAEGRTQVPKDADSLLDPFIHDPTLARGIVTRTYGEASFWQLVILGDYFPEVIRVPCKELPRGGTQSLYQEVELVSKALSQKPFRTAHNVAWEKFDRWILLPQRPGLPKYRSSMAPDYQPRLDALFIIWRNLAYRLDIQRPPLPCNYGFGLWVCDSRRSVGPFLGGIETASSYTTCGTARGAAVGFLAEFFHGLYGGNHWHTAGGAGLHTFPFLPVCRGLSTQGSRPIYAIGYDRWLMGWKAQPKTYLISALDEQGQEVSTDFVQPSRPEVWRVWLRDFLTTGDAVRIRFPYIEKGSGKVKPQYLWLENRRFLATSEVWGPSNRHSCESVPPPPLRGFPGLYAYIQVGKDKKEGTDIYSADPSHPNGLGSWIFWLPAEGRYDLTFRPSPKGWALDKASSLPNPFTGMHDFYLSWDENGDGQVQPTGEGKGHGIVEWRGDSACESWYAVGDAWDAFQVGRVLSLETNPVPVPVYTLRSEEGYRYPSHGKPAPYDNRSIWLSGLAIKVLRERSDGAILVEIRWDAFALKRAIRWCGDIHLSPNPFDSTKPALQVYGKLLLDRSDSPTYPYAVEYDSTARRYIFSDTTQLVVEPGAVMSIERRGKVILRRGSRLVISSGARLTGQGTVEVEKGGKVICLPGASCSVRIRYRKRPYPLFLQ
ncbi:MAG: hypothetical protein N3E49_06480 [Bacteroidia bacterium]|nr:hypothetical protein [Bacteroidia bacterium]